MRVFVFAGVTCALAMPACGASLKIGKSEAGLNILSFEGYAQNDWVKPFEAQTGCKVVRSYAGSTDEMLTLMKTGGGAQYDVVSAGADSAQRLIADRAVQPLKMSLIPAWHDFLPPLQSPAFNTVHGVHYGISYEWGPNLLMFNSSKLTPAPISWAAIYDKAHAGAIVVPDNVMQIADAAQYLSVAEPTLGIKDPYELTQKQMDRVEALLSAQKPLVKAYWAVASDQIDWFKTGSAVIGPSWPYMINALKAANIPVAETMPAEGATAWADSWMITAKAAHPNCAYQWINFVSTPLVQAQQALSFGETPANGSACAEMNKITPGSCSHYHADAGPEYLDKIHFYKLPQKQCGNGHNDCLDFDAWRQVWQRVRG